MKFKVGQVWRDREDDELLLVTNVNEIKQCATFRVIRRSNRVSPFGENDTRPVGYVMQFESLNACFILDDAYKVKEILSHYDRD